VFFAGDWRGFWRRVAVRWTIWFTSPQLHFFLCVCVCGAEVISPQRRGALVLRPVGYPAAPSGYSRRLANGVAIAVAIALGITITGLTAENVAPP